MTHILYGAPASLYTGKVRSYLRKQNIDFVEMSPGSERYLQHIAPTVGRWIVPCLETPDGEVVQDGADIIDYFERGAGQQHLSFSSYPESPTLLAIGHLFEIFGGEGLLRPAMHYRWSFDEVNLEFLTSEFAMLMPQHLDEAAARAAFLRNSGRMRKAAVQFGVTPEAGPTIEAAFEEWLDLFSAHLADHPYLLGRRPTIGDFGLMAAMWAHLFRDPKPQMLIKQRAPRVGRWVERMSTTEPYLHEFPNHADELVDDAALPDTLLAMMRFVAEEYMAEVEAHYAAANDWLADHPDIEPGTNGLDDPAARGLAGGHGLVGRGAATFPWRGRELTTAVLPYRFWLFQRLQDDLAGASPSEREHVRAVFGRAGLLPMLDLRTLRRVERVGHLEVWGPAEPG